MNVRHDVVIVGAGIVGAACAHALVRDGHRVLVLERGPIGGGATAAGMGHIVVMDDSPAQLALTSLSRQLWRQLASDLPVAAESDHCGTMWLAANEAEMSAVERKCASLAEYDVAAEVLGPRQLARAEPQLREHLAGGLRVPDDFVVYPPAVAAHLLLQAQALGAEVRRPCHVRRVDEEGTLWLDDASHITSSLVVIAAGVWAPDLVPGLRVRPRKGHLVITDRYPGFVRHQLIELGYLKSAHVMQRESVAFNIQPRKTGQMLIGSSRQLDVEDTKVEMALVGKMLRRAVRYLPALGQLSTIRIWTGHRAATDDKLPLIGPSVGNPHVWLATGHEGLGIATSLGTAQLLADQLAGRNSQIPVAPYLPARYVRSEAGHE